MGSVERFAAFRRKVLADPLLQARLQPIEAWPAFIDAAVVIAAEEGVALTREDITAAVQESRRSWRDKWV